MKERDNLLNQPFTSNHKKRDIIIEELRNSGCRITKQRKIILDIILNNECSCCKEIYYQAIHEDSSIGIATVYRMIKKLEEIGAIDRKNQYQVSCEKFESEEENNQKLNLGDRLIEIKGEHWYEELRSQLRRSGYIGNEQVSLVVRVTG